MKLIHLESLLVWGLYSAVGKYLTFKGSFPTSPLLLSFVLNFIAGVFFGVLFLYLFSHEDFFAFAKNIEKKEEKQEKKWVHRLAHFGKIFSVFLIAVLAGPMVSALSAKFLIPKLKTKYLLVGIFGGLSSIFWLAVARGLVHPLF